VKGDLTMARKNKIKIKVPRDDKIKQNFIAKRIDEGKLLPFVSNTISNDLIFGSHEDLVEAWADYIDYPFDDRQRLTRLTQYDSVMSKANPEIETNDYSYYIQEKYLEFLKKALLSITPETVRHELEADIDLQRRSFSDFVHRAGRLHLDKTNPLLILANFPLPIYLTTSYHKFLEAALKSVGKEPRTEICDWKNRLRGIPSVSPDPLYLPTKEEPLVYHLHGLDTNPATLVLTEDDHVDFLVAISRANETIPPRVQQALVDSALLFLGYSLGRWDFRDTFRGLIKTGLQQRPYKSVAIQLMDNELEKIYFKNYLAQEANFDIYWGRPDQFLLELWQDWAGEPYA
jgi:hypothetical protein